VVPEANDLPVIFRQACHCLLDHLILFALHQEGARGRDSAFRLRGVTCSELGIQGMFPCKFSLRRLAVAPRKMARLLRSKRRSRARRSASVSP
jgi:hypothetical protein